jgi:hypothetical protein
MNPDQAGWLEVSKALGPYIVAAIAIIGTFLSAGLAQKNWQRQFGAQQSVVLFNKRLELAEELPSRLFELVQRSSSLMLKARLSETLAILNSEGRNFPQETIDGLVREQKEEAEAFQSAMGASLKAFFLTNAFFDDKIAKEAGECLSAMKQLTPSQEMASAFRNELKQCAAPGVAVEQTLIMMHKIANEHLLQVSKPMSGRIGNLARLMVEYAKPNV